MAEVAYGSLRDILRDPDLGNGASDRAFRVRSALRVPPADLRRIGSDRELDQEARQTETHAAIRRRTKDRVGGLADKLIFKSLS